MITALSNIEIKHNIINNSEVVILKSIVLLIFKITFIIFKIKKRLFVKIYQFRN